MRNLKKVLSLVLALMMVLSVMVTANAAFEDVADSNYKEAIEVLVAAGVLNGKSETSFDPQGTLKRSEAAKIITYVLLGGDVPAVTADTLSHPFTDVAKGQWMTNPINYCYAQGIIDGRGNGTFDPNGTLDGYAFAKMLLVAAGINGEYTGANYKKNVSTAAYSNGLLAGLPASFLLSSNLTREQAAQMAFNALSKSGVATGGQFVVEIDGQPVVIAEEDVVLYKALGLDVKFVPNTASGTGFGSALKLAKVTDVNAEGKNIHYWTVDGKKATVDYVDDVYVASYLAGTTYAEIVKDLGVNDKNTKGADWYANGELKNSYSAVEVTAFLKNNTKIEAPVNVYVDGYTGDYKVLATIEYFATAVVAKDAEKDGDNKGLHKVDFTVVVKNGTYVETVYAAKDAYTNGGAYLVVPQGDDTTPNGFLSVKPATSETVTITGKGNGYVKAGATTYTFAIGRTFNLPLGATYQLWLSSTGTVISANLPENAPVEAPAEVLVYVTGYYSLATKVEGVAPEYNEYGELINGDKVSEDGTVTKYYVQAVNVDGEEVKYEVAKATFDGKAKLGTLAAISFDKDGIASFATPTTAVELTLDANAKRVTVGTGATAVHYWYNTAEYVTVSGTLSKLVVGSGDLKGAVKGSNVWAIYTGKDANKTVTKVFYAPDTTPVTPDTTYSYAILAEQGIYVESNLLTLTGVDKDKDGKDDIATVYTHYVYINGVEEAIMTYSETIDASGFYKYAVDEHGVYELVKLTEGVYDATIANVYGVYVTDDGAMTDYDVTGVELVDLREGDAADGKLEIGDEILYYAVDTNNDKVVDITLIYIVG